MTYWYPGVVEAARILKERFKGVPIILGGNYASLCFEHALRNSSVDYVFRGDNIRELVRLISAITNAGLNYEEAPSNFSDFPVPAYEFYQTNLYAAIRISRGCPFRCSYCAVGILADNFEQKAPLKIIDEIKHFYSKFGIKDFAFYDDALLLNCDKHLKPILEVIINEGINCRFHTPNGLQARFLTQELAKLMYRAGFVEPILSFETVDTLRQIEMGGKGYYRRSYPCNNLL